MAPVIPGTSTLCICEDKLISSLADSATFRSLVSATTAAEAKESIYLGECPSPVSTTQDEYTDAEYAALFPLAVIFDGDEGGIAFKHTSDGGPAFGYTHDVSLNIAIEAVRVQAGSSDVDEDWHWLDDTQHINIAGQTMILLGGLQNSSFVNENAHRAFKDICMNILEEIQAQSGAQDRFAVSLSAHSEMHLVDVEETSITKARMILNLQFLGDG